MRRFPAKYVLLIMTLLCAVIIGCSLKASETGPVSTAAGSVIAPMQKGVNKLGITLTNVRNHLQSKKSLETENEQLREQLADAQASLNQVQLNQEELDNLKKLYQMDQTYADYEKVAANVIGKDAGNWFSVFLIDRGSNDGISERKTGCCICGGRISPGADRIFAAAAKMDGSAEGMERKAGSVSKKSGNQK